MFYYFLPPPIEYAQTYEECRLESLKRQLRVEQVSPYPDSFGRGMVQNLANLLDNMCFNRVREQELEKRQQELINKKKMQREQPRQTNKKNKASEWGENAGKITCQILAANPTIQTWDHFNFLASQDPYFVSVMKNFKTMKYYSQEDVNAENDFKVFSAAMLKKQSQYQNCLERLSSLQ